MTKHAVILQKCTVFFCLFVLFLNNCDLSPGRGIGLVLFHFWPTSFWCVPLWWVHWLGWRCPPLPQAFHKPPAVCASSPRIEQIRQEKMLDWGTEITRAAIVLMNGKHKRITLLIKWRKILRKPGKMARRRKLIKKRSVTKSNYETRLRKWQLPVCTISARLLLHRRLQPGCWLTLQYQQLSDWAMLSSA